MFSGEAAGVGDGSLSPEEDLGGEDEVVPGDVEGAQGDTDLLLRLAGACV